MRRKWSTLYALNVGRGDSFAFELEAEGREPFRVLVDGGDETEAVRVTPQQFMTEKGWDRLDLMILTHIHWDHIIGLLRLAKEFKVAEAVLPYPAFRLPRLSEGEVVVLEAYDHFRLYEELIELLQAQGTVIHYRPPFGERTEWTFGEFTFRHLSPVEGEPLPLYASIRELVTLGDQNQTPSAENAYALLHEYHVVSNRDSSIWLLERSSGETAMKEQLILLGGDALLDNWERLLTREKLQPRILKVSHHGKPDAIDANLVQRLKPDWLLITNFVQECEEHAAIWAEISRAGNCPFFVTGEVPDTRWLMSELPELPVREK
ncbi:ComEC/Rec2 family competence protein [Paenibacillus turpanensis]|uniref:ComEC/Rec2 family competence protein n=1 Tax=Paenibacillus turpanensis TaxID=2689078 RepID=UPI0014078283|nr:MBL fold metallo-hydrolase [Paenibacillus turpanensis]